MALGRFSGVYRTSACVQVGLAMRSATDVAKAASGMHLLDDSFAAVVGAVMWGRSVGEAVRKLLQYQLTVGLSAVLLTLIGATRPQPHPPIRPRTPLLGMELTCA